LKKRWPLLVLSLVAAALLLNLGFWQLRRLGEKEALIATIDERLKGEAMTLGEAVAAGDIEFRRVKLSGRFLDKPVLRKLTSYNGSPGFDILQPFLTTDNRVVLVHRGAVPENYSDVPAQVSDLEAVITLHNKGQGFFDPENDPAKGLWYWWDVPEMLATIPPQPDAETMPFIAQQISVAGQTGLPAPLTPKAELKNNHLGYAITWFGLAAACMGVAAAWAFSKRTASA
jgi:surfeit locus 1 family protein